MHQESEVPNLDTIEPDTTGGSSSLLKESDHVSATDVSLDDEQIGTTRFRFVLVTLFACYAFINQVEYVAFATIVRETQDKYNVSAFLVNLLSLLIPVVYIIGVIPGAWLFGKIGLRWTITCGITSTAIASVLKLVSNWSESYAWLVVAQIFVAFGQILYLALPTTFADTWFPVQERTIATAIVSLAGFAGMAVGMFYSPYVVHLPYKMSNNAWGALWGSQCGFSVVTCVLIWILFPAKPDKKPSRTTAKPPDVGMLWSGLKAQFHSFNMILITAAFGLSLGTLTGLAAMLTQLLEPFGVDETKACILAFSGILAGAANCALFGTIIDRTHTYKLAIVVLLIATVVLMVILVILTKTVKDEHFAIGAYVLVPILEFVVLPVMPLTMELSVEVSYPHPPVVATTMVLTSMCFVSFVMMIIFSVILGDEPSTNDTFICLIIVLAVMVVSLVGFLFCKQELKRLNHEHGESSDASEMEPLAEGAEDSAAEPKAQSPLTDSAEM